MTDDKLAEAVAKFTQAAQELADAICKAFQPVLKALSEFASAINTLVKFRLLPAWNYLQTHEQLDERYAASPISVSLSEIFYPNAPPEFIGLN